MHCFVCEGKQPFNAMNRAQPCGPRMIRMPWARKGFRPELYKITATNSEKLITKCLDGKMTRQCFTNLSLWLNLNCQSAKPLTSGADSRVPLILSLSLPPLSSSTVQDKIRASPAHSTKKQTVKKVVPARCPRCCSWSGEVTLDG